MKESFGNTGDNKGNNSILLFVLLAIVIASTFVKSTKPYRKYQMVVVAAIVGLIIYTYTKKKFGDIRTNTIEGSAVDKSEVLLIINMSTSLLTWSDAGGNTWKTSAASNGNAVAAPGAIKSIPAGTYQLHNYDPNFSVESFFKDGNTTYKNNNADLAYVIYDLTSTVVDGNTKYTMYIAFASISNCPGCSALIESLNKGPSGAGYTMQCTAPMHNTRYEFEDPAGANVAYMTPACPAGSTSPNIVYYNALPTTALNGGTLIFKKEYPVSPVSTVSLARLSSVTMSSLYSVSSDIAVGSTPQPPKFTTPPEDAITFVYNRYRGLLIESVVPTVSGASIGANNKRIVTYRSISAL